MQRQEIRHRGIQALGVLQKQLTLDTFGPSRIQEAIEKNPWYSPYYIEQRLVNINSWLEPQILNSWVESYSLVESPPLRVGLITAANLPLVGFHDVISILLSGHRVFLKCSRRDSVLMKRLCEVLWDLSPSMRKYLIWVEELPPIDYLIASGGNMAAKQLEFKFKGIPKLLRKHRFSLAVIKKDSSFEELKSLLKDIFLFNGLGCRSVSNIILPESKLSPLLNLIKSYPEKFLTPPYIEKLTWQRAKYKTLSSTFIEGEKLLLVPANTLEDGEIGTVRVIFPKNEFDVEKMIQKNLHQLQCVVNKGIEFGTSQYPTIDTFEDNLNLLEILTHLTLQK